MRYVIGSEGGGEETNQLWTEARGYILTFCDLEKMKDRRKKKKEVMKKIISCQAKSPQ